MPRVTDIHLLKQERQNALVIKQKTSIQNLPVLIGESYRKLGAYLGETNETISDVPFVAYHNMDMENLEVEIGFPVASKLQGNGEIQVSEIAAGYKIFCIYRGSYAQLETVYQELQQWMDTNGYEMVLPSYEYYYNGPDCPEEELLTRIVIPVKRKK